MPLQSPPVCRRCGRCCRLGGPALHTADLPLWREGRLAPEHLLTLRRGEGVTDNLTGRVGPAPAELIKLRPVPDGRACLFYANPPACRIHDAAPLECRSLFCDDPAPLAGLYDKERLTRFDLLEPGGPLAELCAHHEEQTDLVRLAALARLAAGGDAPARQAVAAALALDTALRQLLPERLGITPDSLPFYLGRPLTQALPALRAALTPGGLYKRRP